MVPADSSGISPVPPYSGYPPPDPGFPYGAITLYGAPSQALPVTRIQITRALQPRRCRNSAGLGSSRFARHYSGNHYYFLFLRVLRCFSSPGSPPCGYHASSMVGCPIRTPADQLLFADPRRFSQLIASFIASESLGIPHTPLFTSYAHDPPGWKETVLHTGNHHLTPGACPVPHAAMYKYNATHARYYFLSQHVKELRARLSLQGRQKNLISVPRPSPTILTVRPLPAITPNNNRFPFNRRTTLCHAHVS